MEKKLEVKNLQVSFRTQGGNVKAVRDISFDLYKGETLAIVGESGSGKSVLTKTLTGMLESNGRIANGQILYHGKDLTENKTFEDWTEVRGKKIATIFQDPMTSLNPLRKIGSQIAEVIRLHRGASKEEAKAEAIDLLKRVGIKDAENRYKRQECFVFELETSKNQQQDSSMGCI